MQQPRPSFGFARKSLCSISISLAFAFTGAMPVHAQSAKESVGAALAIPLQPVPELIKNKKFEEALGKLKEADAVPNKTPYETYIINHLRAAAAAGAGEMMLSAQAYEVVLASGRLPAAEALPIMEAIAGIFYNAKDYKPAATWAQRYLKDGGTNPQTRLLMVRAMYFGGDYANVRGELMADIKNVEKAEQKPTLEQLQMLASIEQKANDWPAYTVTLEKLVAHYPKDDYWKDLIYRVASKPTFSASLHLNMTRLRYALGQFAKADDYVDLADRVNRAGFPIEAKQVVEQGFAKGLLGTGSDAAAHQKLRAQIAKEAAEDQKDIKRAEAEASKAKDGTGLIGVGFNYVVSGDVDKGAALMEQGLKKGGLKRPDEAALRLGMAYAMAGQKQKALDTLKTIQGADGAEDLAKLWSLYAKQATRAG